MRNVLESTRFVVDHSVFVSIDRERAAEFAKGLDHGSMTHWLAATPFDFSHFSDDDKLSFLFLFNALSFSYWGEPKWSLEQDGKIYDGAWGLVVALGRAVKADVPILDSAYCAGISRDAFADVLRGNVEIPLFEERWRIIKELGSVGQERPFWDIVKSAQGDALALLEVILDMFSSFRDESMFQGKTVYFEKRAQLLVSDIHNIFLGMGYGNLRNIDLLTACADYKLPRILRKLGILQYTADLSTKIDKKIEVSHGSQEEIEIRANTIHAVELIKEEARRRNPTITSVGINDHLWLLTQEKFSDDKPYHRTRSTAY